MGAKGGVFKFMRKTYSSLKNTTQIFIPKRHIGQKGRQTMTLHGFKSFSISSCQLFHLLGEFSVITCFRNVILYYKYCLNLPEEVFFYCHFVSDWNWTNF